MDFSKQYEKAEDAYKKRNYDYAIELYLNILQMDPNQTRARSSLRAIITKKKEEGTFKGVGRMSQALFAGKLKTMQVRRAHEEIVREADRQLTTDPDNPGVLKALGVALYALEHWEGAQQAFDQARLGNPKDLDCYRHLGRVLEKRGELDAAGKFWQRVSQLAPSDMEANKKVREIAARISSEAWDAKGDYRSKLKDAKVSQALEEAQHVARTEEDILRALRRIDEALEEAPDNSRLWRQKAELHEKHRDYPEALAAFQKQLELDPESYDALDRIGGVKIRMAERRRRAAEEALSKTPDDEAARQEVAAARRDFLQVQTDEFARRAKAHPTDMKHRFDLGLSHFQLGNLEDAIGNFQLSVHDPKYANQSLLYLAQAFGRKGQFDLALGQAQRGLEAHGVKEGSDTWKNFTYVRADLLEKAGRLEEAYKAYESLYLIDIAFRDVSKRYENLKKRLDDGGAAQAG